MSEPTRARHFAITFPVTGGVLELTACKCGQRWPCDAIRETDRADKAAQLALSQSFEVERLSEANSDLQAKLAILMGMLVWTGAKETHCEDCGRHWPKDSEPAHSAECRIANLPSVTQEYADRLREEGATRATRALTRVMTEHRELTERVATVIEIMQQIGRNDIAHFLEAAIPAGFVSDWRDQVTKAERERLRAAVEAWGMFGPVIEKVLALLSEGAQQ